MLFFQSLTKNLVIKFFKLTDSVYNNLILQYFQIIPNFCTKNRVLNFFLNNKKMDHFYKNLQFYN